MQSKFKNVIISHDMTVLLSLMAVCLRGDLSVFTVDNNESAEWLTYNILFA